MPIIRDIVIIFALSIGILLISHRLRLPSVVGFLITGIVVGPHALGMVKEIADVEMLATIGIVLLLFTVGMEFSIKNIIRFRYYFFLGGALQVFLTIFGCVLMGSLYFGIPWTEALFYGFLVSLSSTAIVLRVLDEKGESESPHGRMTVGILIFQDIVAMPMLILVPILAGSGSELGFSHFYEFAKGLAFLSFMSLVAFKGVPFLLYYVTRTRNRELFLLSVLAICFAVAWITSSIGLSVSLGAFLAGLVVSESEYSHEAVGNILPFQSIFTSFFFISTGMLLDLNFVLHQPWLILGIAAGVIVFKGMVGGGTALILGMPLRAAILAGMALSQIGEFSLVLAYSGYSEGITTDYQYQMFLSVALLTMAITPLMMNLASPLSVFLERLPLPKLHAGHNHFTEKSGHIELEGHLIIVGFGVRGKHLARLAKQTSLPYVILEMNPETVAAEKAKGEPIQFGDPSNQSVLLHVGIKKANTLVVVINDPAAAMRIVRMARSMNPSIYIIARTRYFREVPSLFHLGANDVIPDEFGSSLEILARVLQRNEMPQAQINKYVNEMRSEGYETLRWHNREAMESMTVALDSKDAHIETIHVKKGSLIEGKSVAESQLKKDYGLTVLLIKRGNLSLTTVEATTVLNASDSLVVLGTPDNIRKAREIV